MAGPLSTTRLPWSGLAILLAAALLPSALAAQGPPVHYFHHSNLPPGTVGRGQLERGGPLRGYFQPVEIRVPQGALISLAQAGQFGEPDEGSVTAGMLIGEVYRLRVANIPLFEGLEVYPSIEVVNRLYPPCGMERKFPIPIDITAEELELALNGHFVTRVIYLENPDTALPVNEDPKRQSYYEVRHDEDPLLVADRLGRPMAILRLGSRVPDRDQATGLFTFGMPPLIKYPPLPEPLPPGEAQPARDVNSAVIREARDYPRIPLPAPQGPYPQAGPYPQLTLPPQIAVPGAPSYQTPGYR